MTVSNNRVTMNLTVKDAFYMDYENDGNQNDIIAEYHLEVILDKKINQSIRFEFHTDLILPSGRTFSYTFDQFLIENDSLYHSFDFTVVFWDHALESGWYELISGITLYEYGYATNEVSTIFDPPSDGSGDSPPPPSLLS